MPPSGNASSGAFPLPELGLKLLIDENLALRLVAALADLYPGSVHVRNVGLEGSADLFVPSHLPDSKIMAVWPDVKRQIIINQRSFRKLDDLFPSDCRFILDAFTGDNSLNANLHVTAPANLAGSNASADERRPAARSIGPG